MRNLKRALSLALAAAMLIGMMVIGASAAEYGDTASVKNTEAVEVLTGLGVVGGDQNGNFNPNDTLTRAEFCVMIANSLTGGTFDQALFDGTNTPFTDVKGHWGANYIAYCYSVGVIAGTSATTFSPDATLTAAQASAILLSALGYNQNNEFGANGQFELNVTKWAQQAGLYEGMSVSASAGISRDNTAKLIFNALVNTTPVNYSTLIGSYYTVGSSAVDGVVYSGKDLDPVQTGTSSSAKTRYTYTLGYNNFDLVKSATGDVDNFGRPCSVWGVDTDDNGTIDKEISTVSDKTVATFTAKTKAAAVATALNGYSIDSNTGSDVTAVKVNNSTKYTTGGLTADVDVFANSKTATATTLAIGTAEGQTIAEAIAALTENGKVVEVYVNTDNVITDIVVVTYTVAKVNSIATAKDKVTYTFSNSVPAGVDYSEDSSEDDTIQIYGTIAKGDYVTAVKPAGSSVLYVYPTTSITGTQTSKTNDGKVTISGTQYTIGSGVASVGTFNNSDKSAIYYLDQYGYVVETTSTAASTDYALVIGVNGTLTTTVDGKTPGVEARVLLADGTVAVYNVKLEKDKDTGDYTVKGTGDLVFDADNDTTAADVTSKADTALKNNVYGYGLADGTITLESLAEYQSTTGTDSVYVIGNDTTPLAIKQGVTSYSANSKTVLADKNTVFVVYNAEDKVATLYTGASNLPNSIDNVNGSGSGATGYAVLKTGSNANIGTASVVFVNTASGLTADSTKDYVYIDATKWTETLVNGETKYIYTGTKADGTTITLAPGDKIGTGVKSDSGLYTYDADNVVNTTKLSAGQYKNAENALTVSGDLLGVAGNYYNITENTQVVYVDDNLAEMNGNKGFVVLAVENGDVTNDVEAVFVTAD